MSQLIFWTPRYSGSEKLARLEEIRDEVEALIANERECLEMVHQQLLEFEDNSNSTP